MTCDQINSDVHRQEVEDLRQCIQTEKNVLILRHKAARLRYVLDLVMTNQLGSCPSDD